MKSRKMDHRFRRPDSDRNGPYILYMEVIHYAALLQDFLTTFSIILRRMCHNASADLCQWKRKNCDRASVNEKCKVATTVCRN